MTNGEAHAINILAHHLLGQDPNGHGLREPPSDLAVREALAMLAGRAHKHMMAGITLEQVRALWESRQAPSVAAATAPEDTVAERLREQLSVVIARTVDAAGQIREALEGYPTVYELTERLAPALELLDDIAERADRAAALRRGLGGGSRRGGGARAARRAAGGEASGARGRPRTGHRGEQRDRLQEVPARLSAVCPIVCPGSTAQTDGERV